MKISIDTDEIKFRTIVPYLIIAGLIIFLLLDKCGACTGGLGRSDSTPPEKNPYAEAASDFTIKAGNFILESCAPAPENVERRYTNVAGLPNNPDRLKITMYVSWRGESSCRYRIDGILTIDKNGCNPRFTKTGDNTSKIWCVLMPGCTSNIDFPECF